jgi:putative membrane protein
VMWDGYGYPGAGLLMMFLLVVLVLGLIVAAVVSYLVGRPFGSDPGGKADPSSARTILDERFARGELDVEEYQRDRAALGG